MYELKGIIILASKLTSPHRKDIRSFGSGMILIEIRVRVREYNILLIL